MNEYAEKKPFGLGLVIGIVAGLVASSCFGGLVGYNVVRKAKADATRGWNLVPVIVASHDMPQGTTITADLIAQRSMPEQFVTSSILNPDSVQQALGVKAAVDLRKGDPLRWSDLGKPTPQGP